MVLLLSTMIIFMSMMVTFLSTTPQGGIRDADTRQSRGVDSGRFEQPCQGVCVCVCVCVCVWVCCVLLVRVFACIIYSLGCVYCVLCNV